MEECVWPPSASVLPFGQFFLVNIDMDESMGGAKGLSPLTWLKEKGGEGKKGERKKRGGKKGKEEEKGIKNINKYKKNPTLSR